MSDPKLPPVEAFWPVMDKLYKRKRDHDEWGHSEQLWRIVINPAERRPNRILVLSKLGGVLSGDRGLPNNVTMVSLAPMVSKSFLGRLRTEIGFGARSLTFLGDLDPFDLWTYAVIRAAFHTAAFPVTRIGICDAWLILARKFVRRPSKEIPWGLPTIHLSAFEKKTLVALEDLVPLEELVEPMSLEMLRAGHKLELEGASNSTCYSDGFEAAFAPYFHRLIRTK